MWRRPLNSTTLATITRKKPEGVSDWTDTQVRARMINKCMVKMIQRRIYKGERLFMVRGSEKGRENTVEI